MVAVRSGPSRRLWALAALICLSAPTHGTVEAIDDQGNLIRLKTPARRIVSLSPHLTELLFEAGAGSRVVGVAAFSDFPEAARRIPRVGDAHGIDLERLLHMRPDLVVGWSSGNARKTLVRIRGFSVPVFESEPRRLADIATTVERLGVLAGTESIARERADAFRSRLATIAATHAGDRVLRVFYQVWDRPLMTIGARHMISDALAVCGARSVFAQVPTLTLSPSREAVILSDPDAILVASRDPEAHATWTEWLRLRAIDRAAVLHVDQQRLHRQTSRVLGAVEAMCNQLAAVRSR